MNYRSNKYICMCIILLHTCILLHGQTGFNCSTQVWMLEEGTERLVNFNINPSNNAIQITPFIDDVQGRIDAIAFNHRDGFLYGINAESFELFRIDSDGNFELITVLDLDASLRYEALVFNREADVLIAIGSVNDLDRSIDLIDFNDFSIQTIMITGDIYVSDYVVEPETGNLYGYNRLDQNVVFLDLNNLSIQGIAVPQPENGFQGVFFNSFGEIFAFGSTAAGVASALFKVKRNGGVETRLSTGPESNMRDFANCPYRVDLFMAVDPNFSFPCNDIEYTFQISNATQSPIEDLDLEAMLPFGFEFRDVNQLSVDGNISFNDDRLSIRDLNLDGGIDSFKARVEILDIQEGFYFASSQITGLDAFLGLEVNSDNPKTIKQVDETRIEVRRIDEDSIFVSYFFCRDDDHIINGQEFGVNLQWEDGTTAALFEVPESGLYELEARSGCQTTIVIFDVTIANCPFNIEHDHLIQPDTLYPCSETVLEFIIDNDTGNLYEGIDFKDTLGQGIEFLEILKNPYGGDLDEDLLPDIVHIDGMDIPDGIDTLRILVEVGDIDPGLYGNRSLLANFPSNLGFFRFSDDPRTPASDSTYITVLGVESDSIYVDLIVCEGEEIVLDGTPYGFEYLWENNSTEASITVADPGLYELQIFSGCEISYVFFDVMPGDEIDIAFDPSSIEIELGDSLLVRPYVTSENDSIGLLWIDPQDSTLSCNQCYEAFVRPYFDNTYSVYAFNGVCTDSAFLEIRVDKTRRVFAPNVFNPNEFGMNGKFFLQSPDYAYVEEIIVVSRWGQLVYGDGKFEISDIDRYWDGWTSEGRSPSGVYMWQARLRFLDGVTEQFSGSITLIR